MNKMNVLLLFVGSVGLIMVAIIFTSIVNKTKNSAQRVDTRAKASATNATKFLGTVNQYDINKNILLVDNMMFDDENSKSLGTWQVTPPSSFNPDKYPSGTNIRILASPATFNILDNTLVATEIEKK